jgi:hypothetical protein
MTRFFILGFAGAAAGAGAAFASTAATGCGPVTGSGCPSSATIFVTLERATLPVFMADSTPDSQKQLRVAIMRWRLDEGNWELP